MRAALQLPAAGCEQCPTECCAWTVRRPCLGFVLRDVVEEQRAVTTAPRASAPAVTGRTTVPGDLPNGSASNDRSASVRRLVTLGYILAVSIPPLGLILGIALSVTSGRQYSRHGLGIIGLSIVASIVWIVILTSGALTTSTTSY